MIMLSFIRAYCFYTFPFIYDNSSFSFSSYYYYFCYDELLN